MELPITTGDKVPRADNAVRVTRDAWVMRMFLAGHSYREIGKHPKVRLSPKGVGDVVNRTLREANPRHNELGRQGAAVYIERLEMMLRAVWPQAIAGDTNAVMVALRVLKQEAKFYKLDDDVADDVAEGVNALDEFRQRR